MKRSTNCTLQLCLLLFVAFCGIPAGRAQNTESAPPQAATRSNDTYKIGTDDILTISVWKEPDLSRDVPVRSDGKISLPLVGELQAAGRTPSQLEQDITAGLRSYITEPQVTVIVRQNNSEKFNVLGQVGKAGSYPLTAGTTVVDAIAAAGGFRDFAKKKDVYVLRQGPNGTETRFQFNYDQYVKGKNTAQNVILKSHDTVVVP